MSVFERSELIDAAMAVRVKTSRCLSCGRSPSVFFPTSPTPTPRILVALPPPFIRRLVASGASVPPVRFACAHSRGKWRKIPPGGLVQRSKTFTFNCAGVLLLMCLSRVPLDRPASPSLTTGTSSWSPARAGVRRRHLAAAGGGLLYPSPSWWVVGGGVLA